MVDPHPLDSRNRSVFDVAVTGGGIVGAFHAWAAARRGLRTILFERSARPLGASVRNFGMVIPSGMAAGVWRERALFGARVYRMLGREGVLAVRPHGTTFVAETELELRVFEEWFERAAPSGLRAERLDPEAVRDLAPGVRPESTAGGLRFLDDVQVEPREAVGALLDHLERDLGVSVRRRTAVVTAEVEDGACALRTATGERIRAHHTFLCPGADLAGLRPDLLQDPSLRHVKLQMMRVVAADPGFRLRTMLAFAPTMCRYATFADCPSLPTLRDAVRADVFERHGIHVLCAQADDGSLLLGDSHHYATDADPYDERAHEEADEAILAYARARLELGGARVTHRWIGHYVESEGGEPLRRSEAGRLHVVTAVGGKGMTVSAALADESLAAHYGPGPDVPSPG